MWLHCTNVSSINHNSCCTLVIKKMQYCLQISGIADYSIEFHGTSAIRAGLNKTKKTCLKKKSYQRTKQNFCDEILSGFLRHSKNNCMYRLLNNCLIDQEWLEDCNPTNILTIWLTVRSILNFRPKQEVEPASSHNPSIVIKESVNRGPNIKWVIWSRSKFPMKHHYM